MITENAIPFQWFKENFKVSRVASQNKINTFSWHQAIMFVIYEKWLMVDQELKKNKDFFSPMQALHDERTSWSGQVCIQPFKKEVENRGRGGLGYRGFQNVAISAFPLT